MKLTIVRGWNRRATREGEKDPSNTPSCPPRTRFPDLGPLASGTLGRHGPSPRWRLGPRETACQSYPPSVQSPLPQTGGQSRRPRERICNPTHPPSLGTCPRRLGKAERHPRGHMSASRQAAERRERTSRLHACAPSRAARLHLRPGAPRPARLPGPALEAPSHARATSPGPVHPQG